MNTWMTVTMMEWLVSKILNIDNPDRTGKIRMRDEFHQGGNIMKSLRTTKKAKDTKDKQPQSREIIEFNNPVEISGDGEYLYIIETETSPKSNFMKGLLQ